MKLGKTLLDVLRQIKLVLSPSCRESVQLQSKAMDNPLTGPQRFGLGVHLVLCRWCRRYGKQVRFICAAARENPDRIVNVNAAELPMDARERLKRAVRNAMK